MKKVVAILLILTGILSIILSMFCFIKTTRGFPSNEVYGGDAYTGIQNAAASTSRNVHFTNEILSFGFGSILIVSGIALICHGILLFDPQKELNLIECHLREIKSENNKKAGYSQVSQEIDELPDL